MSSIQLNEKIEQSERFKFGQNWQNFLAVLDEERIVIAIDSLRNMLKVDNLVGRDFLDIGSGSGLFSLAAMRLGAKRVHSFDYDPQSVACTQELKRRYFDNTPTWTIEQADVLDAAYINNLGKWDFVYSWGVLHHTGNMWQALENITHLTHDNSVLFISIYNDQGGASRRWWLVKKLYNRNKFGRILVLALCIPGFVFRGLVVDLFYRNNPLSRYTEYKKNRGMSRIYDWIDWLGGFPYEVAKPEQLFDFFHDRGFALCKLKTCGGGLGCNEFVFKKNN